MTNSVRFIAEVSSNHNQDLHRCIKFVEAAANIGCDAIKFQLFRIEELFAPEILAISEQHRNRKAWELPLAFVPEIAAQCKINCIDFICSPFYIQAVTELKPYVDCYKISSYELIWDELLIECAKTGKPVILSTGMATMSEVQHAVEVLNTNKTSVCVNPVLLHCTSSYPAPYTDANLAAINTLRQVTNCQVGLSDHTVQPGVLHRAIHRWGAELIEFHMDIDGQGAEYAQGHCWLPDQIEIVIRQSKIGLEADGNGYKEAMPSELADRVWRADAVDGLRPIQAFRSTYLNLSHEPSR
ncbi:MAG: N-acetylneuraminic acid synthase [Gammaproteobacteria bacterium]|nr:N-acetylneuraminic acid synthase [Gammaproteobacteria bacterium]